MDTTLVKFLILWVMCKNIVLTTSMALKEIDNEDANTREKRSPASLFGLNLGNPISAARQSFNSIGNIFSGSGKNTHHNKDHEPTQHYGQLNESNTNTLSPKNTTNPSVIPNSMTQDDFLKENKFVRPQEDKNDTLKKTVLDNNQKANTKPVPAENIEAPEHIGDNPENGVIDKQLLDYIFQKPQLNNDDAGITTADNNIDFVTETGEYETTTGLDQRILPDAAVASLLG